ncbi:UTP--glucose-1-phosphate uridylyltransferase [Candidatus Omnitrophota bacterium]
MLTFYGKGLGRPEVIITVFTPPGEDSAAFLTQQRTQPLWDSQQIDWFVFEWGRPSLLAESLVGTEMRYAFNVTRFMMDRSQFAVMYNKDLGFDKKLSHLFLWFHYFIAPFVLMLLIAIPFLSPFSAFAFLTPLTFFILVSFILMEAINTNNFLRHWRQTGNFWAACLLMAKDIIQAFPFYVFLIPHFFKGVWYASNEIFKFIRSEKDPLFKKWDRAQRYKEIMSVNKWSEKGFPLMGLVGILGIIGWVFGFCIMPWLGPVIFIPYLLASMAFLSGMYAFDVFVGFGKNGHLKGMSYLAWFKMLPYAIWQTVYYFWIWSKDAMAILFAKIYNKIKRPIPPPTLDTSEEVNNASSPSGPGIGGAVQEPKPEEKPAEDNKTPVPQGETSTPQASESAEDIIVGSLQAWEQEFGIDYEKAQLEITLGEFEDTTPIFAIPSEQLSFEGWLAEQRIAPVAEEAQPKPAAIEPVMSIGPPDIETAQDTYNSAKQDVEAEQYTLNILKAALVKTEKRINRVLRAIFGSDWFRTNVLLQAQRKKQGKTLTWIYNPQTNRNYIERYQLAQLSLIAATSEVEALKASIELHVANLKAAKAAMDEAKEELDKFNKEISPKLAVGQQPSKEDRNRKNLLSIGANPNTKTFTRMLRSDPDLLEEKINRIKQLKTEGKINGKNGGIAITLLRYKIKTIEGRTALLNKYGYPLNSGNIKFRNEEEVARWVQRKIKSSPIKPQAPPVIDSLEELFESRGLSQSSRDFFRTMLNWYHNPAPDRPELIINNDDNNGNFYTSSQLTENQRADLLGAEEYTSVVEEISLDAGIRPEYDLQMCCLDAGLGSSLKRSRYLKEKFNRDTLGAKGTDLSFEGVLEVNGDDYLISVAEMKMLRLIKEVSAGEYNTRKLVFSPIVSEGEEPSKPSYDALLVKPFLVDVLAGKDTPRTYQDVFDELNIEVKMRFVRNYPSLDDKTKQPTYARDASGSHGEWGFKFFSESIDHESTDLPYIIAFYNGDGTNNSPDRYIVEWILKHNVPLVMLSTTKTGIDKKGGQIGIEFLEDGKVRIRMLERASAISNNQGKLFEEMGLEGGKGEKGTQYFNTNIALVNYGLLTAILQDLLKEVFNGDREQLQLLLTPDLIASKKQGKDNKDYIQLEGPIGTCFLNLHNYFSTNDDPKVKAILTRHNVDKMLRIVNIDTAHRTRFFTPIKLAVDHWFQVYGDYYRFNQPLWMLEDAVEGRIPPEFNLESSYYADVSNMFDAFGKAEVTYLDSLTIKGHPVKMQNATLRGEVEIINKAASEVDLNAVFQGDDKIVVIVMEGIYKKNSDGTLYLENAVIMINDKISFGTSGWRGKNGKDFNQTNVARAVQGVADYYNQSIKQGVILIGYDPRKNNLEYAKLAASILAGNGVPVRIIAEESTPTPVLAYLAQSDDDITGVINFTASHNPAIDDGLKFSPYHGGAADKSITDAISNYANAAHEIHKADYETAVENKIITEFPLEDAVKIYIHSYIIPTLKELGAWSDIVTYLREDSDIKIVVDAMQGTAVEYLKSLFAELEIAVGRQFCSLINTYNRDPEFKDVGGAPNPTLAGSTEAIVKEVSKNNTTLGLGVDGDADRFGITDFGGRTFTANEMIALIAYFLNTELGLKGKIGKTVASSNFINAVARHIECPVIETAVGFKWFVEKAVKEGIEYMVAGEESAHVGIGPFMKSWDDGIAVSLVSLWMIARTKKSLAEYKSHIETEIGKRFFIKTHTIRGEDDSIKSGVNSSIKQTAEELNSGTEWNQTSIVKRAEELNKQKVVELITLDGIKAVFESGDWLLMRPSGTEPAIKLYVEVTDPANEDALNRVGAQLLGVDESKVGAKKEEGGPTKLYCFTPFTFVHFVAASVISGTINWITSNPVWTAVIGAGVVTLGIGIFLKHYFSKSRYILRLKSEKAGINKKASRLLLKKRRSQSSSSN